MQVINIYPKEKSLVFESKAKVLFKIPHGNALELISAIKDIYDLDGKGFEAGVSVKLNKGKNSCEILPLD